jgi:hypothetical protein
MCCLVAFGAFLPRVAMVFMALFSTMFNGAFPNWIVAFIGWLFIPYTTLTYVLLWNWEHHHLNVFSWLLVGLAFILDLANLFGGYRQRQQVPGYPSSSAY